MLFKDIPGQNRIKEHLIRSVSQGRISHAQLFHGPEGSPKLALALAFARYISCTGEKNDDSCGQCPSCLKFNKFAHPDLHFVFPFSPKSDQKDKGPESDRFLAEFRTAIIENPYITEYAWYEKIGIEKKQGIINKGESDGILKKLSLKSYESDYKILIMWLPERMNPTASNKLLKLVEEPPPGTLFLFVSEDPDRILPTILSRTQMLRIPKFSDSEIAELLKQNFQADEASIQNAVKRSNGNYFIARDTMTAGDENRENFERFTSLMRLSYAKDVPGLMNWTESISSFSREKQKNFLEYSIRLLRENFMFHLGKKDITHMSGFEEEFSARFSRFITEKNIESLYTEFNEAHSHVSANGYGRIIFLDLSFKVVKYLHV